MTRYIDGDHLKSWILARWGKEPNSAYPLKASEILYQIDREMEYPIVEAISVRHGKWIYTPTEQLGYRCSVCGKGCCRFNYCPSCGSRMDSE